MCVVQYTVLYCSSAVGCDTGETKEQSNLLQDQSSAVEGSAVEGSAVEGGALEGSAVEGSSVEGSAVEYNTAIKLVKLVN